VNIGLSPPPRQKDGGQVRHKTGGQALVKGKGGSRTSQNAGQGISIMGQTVSSRKSWKNTGVTTISVSIPTLPGGAFKGDGKAAQRILPLSFRKCSFKFILMGLLYG